MLDKAPPQFGRAGVYVSIIYTGYSVTGQTHGQSLIAACFPYQCAEGAPQIVPLIFYTDPSQKPLDQLCNAVSTQRLRHTLSEPRAADNGFPVRQIIRQLL